VGGQLVHVEIAASDMERAQDFWSGVFGWQIGPSMMPEYDYRMFQTGEGQGGALLPGEPGAPTIYFDSDDIDASLAKVREHGGEAPDKQPVPGMGWFAVCKDTEGNPFGIWQTDESAG